MRPFEILPARNKKRWNGRVCRTSFNDNMKSVERDQGIYLAPYVPIGQTFRSHSRFSRGTYD